MLATSSELSVEEYLATSYRPDADYVDGHIIERPMPQLPHSICQRELILVLGNLKKALGIRVYPEQRVQVAPRRFRIPDITVTNSPAPKHPTHLVTPPFLCIEILSPEDNFTSMMDRVADYQSFGVEHIWLIDPERKSGWTWTRADGPVPAVDGLFEAGLIRISLADLDRD